MLHRSSRSPRLLALVASLAVAACAGDKGVRAEQDGDGATGDPPAFVLSSSAFPDGGKIPVRHTCSGIDVSPPLAWTGGEAAGYALVLADRTDGQVHSVLWDVPGSAASLPEAIEEVAEPSVPAGARQALAIDGKTRGYVGPCPAEEHTYDLVLHALDEYPLAGLTLESTRDQLAEVLGQRAVARATLVGTFEPSGW
jgi:phosphatidylethanolamine-binding protein (PEBP) family uncharacterized protein